MSDIPQDATKSGIPFRLFVSFVISSLCVMCIALRAKNISLEQTLAANFSNDESIADKFSKIYETLELISSRNHIISDTHVRTQHYAKPHTSFQSLCPECQDVYGSRSAKVIWVSADRLADLRRVEGLVTGKPLKAPELQQDQEPEELISIADELDSILVLLNGQASFSYTLLLTEMHTNHFIKKHNYPAPRGFTDNKTVGCPDCSALYKKQTEPSEAILRARYSELLEIENNYKNSGGGRTF